VLYNLILAIFNLIPIPPLDGSKMIYAGLKSPGAIGAYRHFSKFGIFILLGLVWLGGFERIVWPVIAKCHVLLELPSPFGR
jgi:Zn-dependent protease